jgi:hypothetical protein
MVALANDDGVKTLSHQCSQSSVRVVDQRTGRLNDIKAALTHAGDAALRCAVRRDNNRAGFDLPELVCEAQTTRTQIGQNGFIVDQLAKDSGGLMLGVPVSQRDGVANAEAHPEMGGAKNSHKTKIIVI